MGGGSEPSAQVVNPGGEINSPYSDYIKALSSTMLNYAQQFTPYGSGHSMAPNMLMGQTYVPGPNQTIFGNPYNTAQQSAGFYGPAAQVNPQQMYASFLHPGQGATPPNQGGQQAMTQPNLGDIVGKLMPQQQQGQQVAATPQTGGNNGTSGNAQSGSTAKSKPIV